MLQTTIGDLLQGKYDEEAMSHNIYIVRDGEAVLYVGRSWDVIGRLLDHLSSWGPLPIDALGATVRENLPAALDWQVEFMTIEECASYDSERIVNDQSDAELAMIAHYRPCLNVMNNPNPHALPKHIKVLQVKPGITDNLY